MNVVKVPSDSGRGDYDVTLGKDGTAYKCKCLGYTYNLRCKHIDRVNEAPEKFGIIKGANHTYTLAAVATAPTPATPNKPLPMLAHKLTERPVKWEVGCYAVEEKFDGHRAIVRVQDGTITAWSRTGKDCRQKFSQLITQQMATMPNGVYDGELINPADRHSYRVSHLQALKLTYVVFDVLELLGVQTVTDTYDRRRKYLREIFFSKEFTHVKLATSIPCDSQAALNHIVERIWENFGEGVIVKRRDAGYHINKRTDAFLKLKKCQTAVLTIIDWEGGTTGPQCVAVLRDDNGNVTRVKIKNDVLRARVAREHLQLLGRKLHIEYHERTPDGSYRHPMWDRLEGE